MKRSRLLREVIEVIVITLLIFIAVRFTVQSYHIEGQSMQPGLVNNEYVVVNKVAYLLQGPARGDVIVFHYPRDTNLDFIKRVIGLPGDTIRIDSSHVWVNGVQLKEPYISAPVNPSAMEWKVPPGQYFVLGDNRPVSDDSRYWGYVPKSYIVGEASIVYWPFSNWELINTYSTAYAQVK